MDETRRLAEFCTGVTLEDIPAEVVQKAKLCVLDYIANVYGSLRLEAVKAVVSYMAAIDSGGPATALGCGFKTTPQNAAFVNGTLAEAIEAQDGVRFGGNHPVSAVLPAAIAMGEVYECSGRDLIEAIVAGYEATNRVAASVHPFLTLSGFLPTGACGTFGAAVAAGRMMDLSSDGILNALGNAGYLTPISMAEDLMAGCTIKIVQGGQAASAGVTAAGLAARGITGHPRAIEGSELNGGFARITLNNVDPVVSRITEGLGESYSITDVYFKPFTSCRHTHGAAQATLELVKDEGFAAKDVESVRVRTYFVAGIATGKGVPPDGTFVSAQFSIPYVVSACLLDGEMGPGQLTDERIAAGDIRELIRRVTVEPDDDLNAMYPDMTPSKVEVVLRDGRRFERQVDIPFGDPRFPMGEGDIAEKAFRFAGDGDTEGIEKIMSVVRDLENIECITELTELV
ncbi:MAG: MmgE/PrpD family protein [Candidatus Geothermincolia bacterium]